MYAPSSILYLIFLLVVAMLVVVPLAILVTEALYFGLGMPGWAVVAVLLMSVAGSFVNIPLLEVTSREPVLVVRDIVVFGVRWRLPELSWRVEKTTVAINVGGALIPLAVSAYLTARLLSAPTWPARLVGLLFTVAITTVVVNGVSRPIRGLGIAAPALAAPFTAALASLLVAPPTCPASFAYVAGTVGTLVGADLLNLHKVPKIGAGFVSIGGAGTFDGVFLSGIFAVIIASLLA